MQKFEKVRKSQFRREERILEQAILVSDLIENTLKYAAELIQNGILSSATLRYSITWLYHHGYDSKDRVGEENCREMRYVRFKFKNGEK